VSAPPPIVFSVDVEDYYQVSAFESCVARSEWSRWESRVARNTERILEIMRRARAKGTFFVLGCVAERDPGIVRAIAGEGHEIASHGWAHHLVYTQDRATFVDDAVRSRDAITAAAPVTVAGFRAASFSIVERSLWALDALADLGFRYDSSVFPVHHDRYGIPAFPRAPHVYARRDGRGDFVEFPISTVRALGRNLAVTGGGYFRLLPYGVFRWGQARLAREGLPTMIYIHPWEIDPDQPRVPCGALTRLRHYGNLRHTEAKLVRLLNDHPVTTALDAIERIVRPNWAA
jgi:polysaccharide deacetylase family protein (PEP-CTERM system associated)